MLISGKKKKGRILRGRAYDEEDNKETPTKPPLALRPVPPAVSRGKTRKELRKEQRKAKKAQKHQYLLVKVGREDLVRQAAEALVAGKKKKKKRKRKSKAEKREGKLKAEEEKRRKEGEEKEREEEGSGEESEEEEDEDAKFVREAVRNKLEGKETLDMAEELKVDKEKMNKDMESVRRKRLLEENEEEEKTIRQLSKKLKLNKKAAIPASFRTDGLDFLLEVCESSSKKKKEEDENSDDDEEEDNEPVLDTDDEDEMGCEESGSEDDDDDDMVSGEDDMDDDEDEEMSSVDQEAEFSEGEEDSGAESEESEQNVEESEAEDSDVDDGSLENQSLTKSKKKISTEKQTEKDKKRNKKENIENEDSDVWEDIYGRLRGKDGSVLTNQDRDNDISNEVSSGSTEKYVPPALRGKQSKREKIAKQLKGLLNRLSESNMHSIATQVEEMYSGNSRSEMNETLLELLYAALVRPSLMPERVVLEHMMLIAILHANIGTEIGAFFTQTFVQKFKSHYDNGESNEDDKQLENLVLIISCLYHFKIFDACLIFDMLKFLGDSFQSKDVELILTVLRSVGFRLRKDDPAGLKELILTIQQKASKQQSGAAGNAKVKFMLEILMAIRNNNMNKIPNYDPSFGEHLLKVLKIHLRPGNYVSELKIGLQDLLNAERSGRWWIVGSAWAGKQGEEGTRPDNSNDPSLPLSSEDAKKHAKLLKRAKAQGMNTDSRRNIFCILMTAEDYMDAFEKLNHLGLRNNQDREIMHVAVHCCLQENQYNPYYALILSRFCAMDRKLMLALQFNLWDRLKDLDSLTATQRKNLACLLAHLINDSKLPLSTLKVIEFAKMDTIKLKFLKRLLTGVLMQTEVENLNEIFVKVAMSEKLSLFRDSLRIFLSHFMLQKTITTSDGSVVESKLSPDKMEVLKERVKIASKCMSLGRAALVPVEDADSVASDST